MKVVFAMFALSFIGMGCASTFKVIDEEKIESFRTIYLEAPQFLDGGVTKAVEDECEMLGLVGDSVQKNILTYGYRIIPIGETEVEDFGSELVLKIVYSKVEANRMSGLTLRPASTANFHISIVKNGEEVNSVINSLSSRNAFTACERLEKIANSTGRYAAKWISTFTP